jgi:uncharacterized iron-regulated membrane protein
MNNKLRSGILAIHRWTGLTLGLALVFIAVTGTGMLFRPQLEPIAERGILQVPDCASRGSLDAIVANAIAAHPGKPIEEIEILARPDAAIAVRFEDRHDVLVNPCTAGVIAGRSHWGGFFGTVEQLHRFRFLGNWAGDVIGGSAAVMMLLVFVAGGVAMWWPASRRAWSGAFKVKWRLRGHAFELNLHRATGIYVCLALTVVGLSALPLAFKPVRYAIYSALGSPMPAPKPKSAKPVGSAAPASLDYILRGVEALMPGATSTVLVPPHKSDEAVEAFAIAADAPHGNARSYAYFDAYTGTLLRFDPYAATSAGNKAHRWLSSLHMGYLGGAFGQLLLLLGALGVPLLACTGISSYLRGRMRRR